MKIFKILKVSSLFEGTNEHHKCLQNYRSIYITLVMPVKAEDNSLSKKQNRL